CFVIRHNDHCSGTVAHLGGIAGSDRTAGLESRLQLSKGFHRGVTPRALINVERKLMRSAMSVVEDYLAHGKRYDFLIKVSGIDRGKRTAMTFERECVLILPINAKVTSDILGGEPHAEICIGICFDQ